MTEPTAAITTETQLRWMDGEMMYAINKTEGLDEHLYRLRLSPTAGHSALTFMGSYWDRFGKYAAAADVTGEQHPATLALQFAGKVPIGFATTVCVGVRQVSPDLEIPEIRKTALDIIQQQTTERPNSAFWRQRWMPDGIVELSQQDLPDTLLGTILCNLQRIATARQSNVGQDHRRNLIHEAASGAVVGMSLWREYAGHVQAMGLDPTMPKPGLNSGNIEPWTD